MSMTTIRWGALASATRSSSTTVRRRLSTAIHTQRRPRARRLSRGPRSLRLPPGRNLPNHVNYLLTIGYHPIVSSLFSFPNPVNEKAARVVAGAVLALSIVTLATGAYWIAAVLAYGFVARVLTGPTLSPLGQLATRVVAPRLGAPKPVPGPPKRFAQAMGATMTTAVAILALAAGQHTAANALLGLMIVAAGLESIFAYCLGCKIFALLMRAGMVPPSVCLECADIRVRSAA